MSTAHFALLAGLLLGCSGTVTTAGGDGGKPEPDAQSDVSSDSPISADGGVVLCNAVPCPVSQYCIHPAPNLCPSCSALPDGGTCPAGSTLQMDCPVGPAMPQGNYCVTPPPPTGAPYCSPTIPMSNGDCFLPQIDGGDVQCTSVPCAA